jgi:predicted nucleic acid-binding Zn ribbon protein
MTVGAVLVGLALLAPIVSIILRPLIRGAGLDELTPEPTTPLRTEPILVALRDLNFDHQTGKVAQEDYARARAELLTRAAQAMAQNPDSSLEDVLEERVKEIRRRLDEAEPAAFCARCGDRLLPGDRFCSRCGNPQTNACPSCGKTVGAEDRFCVECGRQLHPEAAPVP